MFIQSCESANTQEKNITLYFKVSLLQCNYTFKYGVILVSYVCTIWLGLGFGLGLLVIMHN